MHNDFYRDERFCPECDTYVRYLLSVHDAYCTECGDKVRLFSEADKEVFQMSLRERRPLFPAADVDEYGLHG